MSLHFNMLSRLVVAFLPRSKRLLISWLQSPSAMILEPRKIKSATVSTVSPSISHEVMGLDAMIFVFWTLSFQSIFLLSFTFIKRPFSSSWLFANCIRLVLPVLLSLLRKVLVLEVFEWCVSGYRVSWEQRWNQNPSLLTFCLITFTASTFFQLQNDSSWICSLGLGTMSSVGKQGERDWKAVWWYLHIYHSYLIFGKENGNSLQDSCLGNPMDRGAWWATVHEVPGVRQAGATITILSKISFSAYLLLMPSSAWVSWTDQPRIILGCILGPTLFLLCHTFPISSLSADGFFSCYPDDLVCSQLSGSAVIPPFFSCFFSLAPFHSELSNFIFL